MIKINHAFYAPLEEGGAAYSSYEIVCSTLPFLPHEPRKMTQIRNWLCWDCQYLISWKFRQISLSGCRGEVTLSWSEPKTAIMFSHLPKKHKLGRWLECLFPQILFRSRKFVSLSKARVVIFLFRRIAKQFRLMDWWCPSVYSSVCQSVCPSVNIRLTSAFKIVLGHINQYRLNTLHGNRPWWDLLI